MSAILPLLPAALQNVNWALIFAVLWGISEALALIPQVKANSIFQLIYNALSFVKGKLLPPSA